MLTHTIPFPGDPCAEAGVFAGAPEFVEGDADGVSGFACGLAAGVLGGEEAFAAVDWPMTTSGVIFATVEAETPALDKSLTVENGRPAMIFLAVAAPTPGKLSRSFSLALLRSTGAFVALDWPPGGAAAADIANAAIAKSLKNWAKFFRTELRSRMAVPVNQSDPHSRNLVL